VPSKSRDVVKPWMGRDVEVQVEPFALGFAVLVYPEDRLLGMYMRSNRFRFLLRQLEREAGIKK